MQAPGQSDCYVHRWTYSFRGGKSLTLVPFIAEGSAPTVVSTPDEYTRQGGRNGACLLIQDFDNTQLADQRDSNATYDFRVGDRYQDHRYGEVTKITDKGFTLLPGMAVVVETLEEVEFPISLFGVIVPKVSLLHDGISNTTSKIDPGYRGRLYITIFNLGMRPITLVRGRKICSLLVFRTAEGTRGYGKPAQGFKNRPATSAWRRFVDFVQQNVGVTQAIMVPLTVITIAIAVTQCYSSRKLTKSLNEEAAQTRSTSPTGNGR
jgi:dCTP deaminase